MTLSGIDLVNYFIHWTYHEVDQELSYPELTVLISELYNTKPSNHSSYLIPNTIITQQLHCEISISSAPVVFFFRMNIQLLEIRV